MCPGTNVCLVYLGHITNITASPLYGVCVCVCCSGLTLFQQSFSHITTVSSCDTELNTHLFHAGQLWYQAPDTSLDTPKRITLTLRRSVLAILLKPEYQVGSN